MKDNKKALQAIERLVSSDFVLDLEWYLADKGIKANDHLKKVAEIIGEVYKIAHSEVSNCEHKDWEDIKDRILNDV